MTQLTERLMHRGRVARTSTGNRARAAFWIFACGLFGLSGTAQAQLPANLNLPNTTITSGSSTYQATNSITANNGFTVSGSASVTFLAGSSIVLGPGFQATAGSAAITFQASISAATPAPTLTSVSPPSGTQGTAVNVTLGGTNFVSGGSTVSTSNSGIAVSNVTVVNATQITATFTIASGAATGASNVTVTTSGGTTAAVTFTVQAAATQYYLTTAVSPSGGGTITPACGSGCLYSSGSAVTVTATPSSGYQFSGFSGALSGTGNPQNLTITGAEAVTANFTQVQWLTITTSSLGPGTQQAQYAQTLSASGGASPYTWSVTSATWQGNYPYSTAPATQWTVSSAGALSATPVLFGTYYVTVRVTDSLGESASKQFDIAVAPAFTTDLGPLKGFEYFPRGHAWWNLFYDWYTNDCDTNTAHNYAQGDCFAGKVSDAVQADLQTLSNAQLKYVHLYLWDRDVVQGSLGNTATNVPGWVGWDEGCPQTSPAYGQSQTSYSGACDQYVVPSGTQNQWTALEDFISRAATLNIKVALDFDAGWPKNEINSGKDPASVGAKYAAWLGLFAREFAKYQNVVIWGFSYNLAIDNVAQAPTTWSTFWSSAYPDFLQVLGQYPYPGIGRAQTVYRTGPPFGLNDYPNVTSGHQQPLIHGYTYNWPATQENIYAFQYWTGYMPDLIVADLYNSNAEDLKTGLYCLTGSALCGQATPACSQCTAVPASKLLVTEFSTGSSWESAPIGNNVPSYLDNQTPTTTAAGQVQWLTDTMCAMNAVGVTKYGYFGLYDSYSWWLANSADHSGSKLASEGFWGLASEMYGYGNKPSWAAMTGFDGSGCSSPSMPVVAAQTDASYYTINDSGTVTYTAAGATLLNLSEPPPPNANGQYSAYSCDYSEPLTQLVPTNGLVGSCAYTGLTMSTLTPPDVKLSGINDPAGKQCTATNCLAGCQCTQASAWVPGAPNTYPTVGLSPIVYGIIDFTTGAQCNLQTNPQCVLQAGQTDVLEIFGAGFTPSGGNTVQIRDATGTTFYFNEADGLYFWDGSRSRVNVQLGPSPQPPACAAAGNATLSLSPSSNNTGSSPSAPVAITIVAASGCGS